MADNVAITAGSGTNVAADDISSVFYQRVKLTAGGDGVATGDVAGRQVSAATDTALYTDPRPYRSWFTVTPVIDTNIFASGDCLGGLNTITSAARYSGGGGTINSIKLLDKTQAQRSAMSLLFFNQSVTSAGNNAPAAFSDADMANLVAVVEILTGDYNTAWPGTPLNSEAYIPNSGTRTFPLSMSIPYYCSGGTSLYMQAVVRGTPTYTSTSDLVFIISATLD